VTLEPNANGTVKVYAASGGSGDIIEITVEDYDESLASPGQALFVEGNPGSIRRADADGTNDTGQPADVLGPLTGELDSDSLDKIPYVDNGALVLMDENGNNRKTLVSGSQGGNVKPTKDKSLLAVGTWDGEPTSIYYATQSNNYIYRHDGSSSGNPVEIANPGNGVTAVVGIADITGDDSKELVFLDGSANLRYITSKNSSPTDIGISVDSDNGVGVGRPADFDGDGKAQIPVVKSNNIQLVDNNGNTTPVVSDGSVAKAPIAPVDWDNDGALEIVYIDTDGDLRYVDDPGGANSVSGPLGKTPDEKTGVT